MGERTAALTILLCSLLVPGCDPGGEGRRCYREGRYEDAHAAFAKAVESQGNDASAELLWNRGLAALRAGALREAEASAALAASRGGPRVAELAEFLRGNAAFALCELAEAQADAPEAEPFAFDVAIRYGETARDAWRLAAASRPDWPEARRNVERALLRLEELAGKKADAVKRKEGRPDPKLRTPPLPEPQDEPQVSEEESPAEAQLAELSPEQVLRLLEKLAEEEREKLALRRTHRRARMTGVEKDW